MSAEYSVEEALTMIDRIAIAYGSQELEDARAVLAERIKADEGASASIRPQRCSAHVIHPKPSPPGPGNPPLWCCLREGHDGPHRHDGGGMYPSIPFRENDEVSMIAATHPPAQAAQAFALPKSFVDRATSSDESEPQVMGAGHLVQFTTAQVDRLMTFNARLIVNGLHPEDARMWMRATDQWDFDADPVAEADSTWQDFFANPDDDGPFDPTPTAEPAAQGEVVQQEEYGGPDFEERCETLAKIERDMRIYLDEGMLLTPYTLELLCNRIKNVRDAGHDNVVMSLYNFRTLRRLAAQPRAVPDGWKAVTSALVSAAELMISEIDTCGHEVDPAYRLHLYEAKDAAKAMLAAAPQPGESNNKPTDCSGDPSSCPDNEGRGCYCSDLRRAGESA